VFLGSVVLAISAVGAEAERGSALGKAVRVPSNLGFSTSVSPDGQAATIVFDNLYVELSPAHKGAAATLNQTAVQTKLATLHIPYTTDQRSVKMTMDLRGFADVDSAATARLVVGVGDKTEAVDLSSGKDKKVQLKGECKCALSKEQPEAEFGDWQGRIEFTVQTRAAKPVLQVTLLLLVEHDTDAADAGGALLAVDSLDLEIGKPSRGSYKK
jgi:hypothetical protein